MNAYIFDLDGTLLDSMAVWQDIDRDFLRKRGIDVPADYMDALLSMSFPEAAAYTIRRFALPDSVAGLMREWHEMVVYAYGHTVHMKPYAREYIAALREYGAKIAIATSSPALLYEPALRHHGIYDSFNALCSTDEAGQGKSRPDIFLLAAHKLGAKPGDCIVYEDVLVAIQSAKSIGMTVYGVYDESSSADWEHIQKVADGVIRDFRDAPWPK